ncbi:hypothetical protein UF75_5361 [Desulfosporosinus sp. I2]|nr:hypothetical protein UF75_5361 [Desulfosporosinus sp. I2]
MAHFSVPNFLTIYLQKIRDIRSITIVGLAAQAGLLKGY